MADRSLRDKRSKLDKLAEYKRAREGGTRIFKEEDDTIYDEVTEDQYKSIVKGRLQRDDFVVDDGAAGYVDNGMDDWSGGNEEDVSEDEEETRKKAKKTKAKATTVKYKSKPAPAPAVPSISAYRPVVSAEQEEDFMSSLLGTLDNSTSVPLPKKASRKRKPSPTEDSDQESPLKRHNYSAYRRKASYPDLSSDGPMEPIEIPSSDDVFSSPTKKFRVDDDSALPATEQLANLDVYSSSEDFDMSLDDIDMDAFMDLDDDLDFKASVKKEEGDPVIYRKPRPKTTIPTKTEETDTKPAWLSVYDSLVVDTEDTLGPLTTGTSSTNSSNIGVLEADGSMRFFWLDYLELDGKLYFIGKLKDKSSGLWVSCSVTVEGIERNLFVLPRDRRVEQDDDGNIHETDVVPKQEDIHDDFDMIRKQIKIKSWRAKFVKRNYAFGEKDVPRGESQWLKVVYGFHEPVVPMTACSQNIAQIFGTNTTAFELLVLKRKIMGPCWIQIKHPEVDNKGISWCKLEVTVTNPKDFNPFPETDVNAPKDMPPLNVMSLSVRTVVNHQENKREIVCASARIWHNMQIDDVTPPEKLKCTVHTFVRPLDKFPPNFEKEAKGNAKGSILPMQNERMLLSSLLMAIYKADPDVIVGHEFLGVSLDVILNRMRDLKADHWSRLGRFRRSKWPNIGRQGSNLKFLNGRLLCDLASEGAKSMILSTTWSLTEMCKTHLSSEREDYDPDDTASKMEGSVTSPAAMLKFVRHCELDAHFQMAIASKVQILPLTKQLTNLAGNAWNKTLNGGRAERNEYILLHEFHRLKYICPDKTFGKKVVKQEPQDDDQEGGTKTTTKGKRDKYKGGLVFEPKRGLWDKYILVMDFNSLYPSIIQEYNIDFTTVDRVEDDENGDERIPEPPPSDVGQGVLPRLIATLVKRRRQVKSLMKDRTATQAQLLQYDIKQQALKLTANSMYGCLGFEYSRFYARPLAALTTHKGREILTHTRELAESLNLDVVYGDTDSVFVNSNVTELAEALKISAILKKAVNDRYRLLEIDLDAVFQRLLLLQKKKYAAIKVEDGTRTTTEIKGLDMKRREYCALSKQVSQYILEQILSGEDTELVVGNIHEYLTNIGENIRNGSIKLDEFIIFKRLGKNPEDYPDAKSQPHVQVALRLKQKGGSARSGDVIPYVFCISEGEESAKTAQADRAKHPDEVRRGLDLRIDYDYYLSNQILPPIERLCEPIEGTDRSRLAECLGLDPTRFRTSIGGNERTFSGLDAQISDAERFRDATPFHVRCRHCQGQLPFVINEPETSILLITGPTCPACSKTISAGSLQTQLEVQIREHIAKYYEGWTVCDDPTCDYSTRMMGVYGRRCLRSGCKGRVAFKYSDTQLYNQLLYFISLFDGDKALSTIKDSNTHTHVSNVITRNAVLLRNLRECVEKHLNNCGRRWVDLRTIFSLMKV
ncbi:DNA polymerase alpha catalytic subunit [Phlegmacium glaucopus]|nr:DNA polymerase alpha catalytic subunit [Phlegmacium glaucopus]